MTDSLRAIYHFSVKGRIHSIAVGLSILPAGIALFDRVAQLRTERGEVLKAQQTAAERATQTLSRLISAAMAARHGQGLSEGAQRTGQASAGLRRGAGRGQVSSGRVTTENQKTRSAAKALRNSEKSSGLVT